MAVPNIYTIEHRNKAGNLLRQIQHLATKVQWEWNRKGGCGRCKIRLAMPYRKFELNALDDIQIRVKSGSTSKLVYRGWLAGYNQVLQEQQTVDLDIRGYFDFLKYLVVHDSGAKKTYTSEVVSDIVDDIVDTFVVANSDITKGTIDTADYTAGTIDFKVTVEDALRTLADLEGGVEYGVDEDLVFFWRDEGTSVSHKFIIGNDVKVLQRKTDFTRIINKYYFEGGESGGTVVERTAENTDSQSSYFLAEKVLVSTGITTNGVADQLMGSLLDDTESPKFLMSLTVPDTTLRLEDTIPLGKISIHDDDYDVITGSKKLWGTTANGGDNVLWGRAGAGGSEFIWGAGAGIFQDQVDYIRYTLSNTEGRYNIVIGMGGTRDEAAAKIKQIQLDVSNIRQGRV